GGGWAARGRVGTGGADGAGPVSGGDGRRLVREKDPVADVAAPGDGTEGRGAIEAAVDAPRAIAAEGAGPPAWVRAALTVQQGPGSEWGNHRLGCGVTWHQATPIARSAPSRSSSWRLRSTPQRYPARLPSAFTTR